MTENLPAKPPRTRGLVPARRGLVLDRDTVTGWYRASLPGLPGCVVVGISEQEALQALAGAARAWILKYAKQRKAARAKSRRIARIGR